MTATLVLFVDACTPEPSLRSVLTVPGAQPAIETRTTGSRRYRAGRIWLPEGTALDDLYDAGFPNQTCWACVWGAFIRIVGIGREMTGRLYIDCDQSNPAVTHIDGDRVVALRVVEPSPPRPPREWLDEERVRAIRDWEASRRGDAALAQMTAAVDAVFREAGLEGAL